MQRNNDPNDSSDPEAKKKEWTKWVQTTEPYKTSFLTQLYRNNLISLLLCRKCRYYRKKSHEEEMVDKGVAKVTRDLDIRNLIKA